MFDTVDWFEISHLNVDAMYSELLYIFKSSIKKNVPIATIKNIKKYNCTVMQCVTVQCIKLVVSGIDAALNTCLSIFRDLSINAASKVKPAFKFRSLAFSADNPLNFECHMFNAAFIRTALRHLDKLIKLGFRIIKNKKSLFKEENKRWRISRILILDDCGLETIPRDLKLFICFCSYKAMMISFNIISSNTPNITIQNTFIKEI
ncbi:hypothetical protein BpHYR1_047148 [Brachionus plicatilis]|uniref:Uncharacterized protein n=1 Tax=Brachionus plicatilis TaxID=10195 RepID=A0A3M7R457_BRAPC|nr:hypothetical protein BpHYR1_047148 [Brachionus plicatilis]